MDSSKENDLPPPSYSQAIIDPPHPNQLLANGLYAHQYPQHGPTVNVDIPPSLFPAEPVREQPLHVSYR